MLDNKGGLGYAESYTTGPRRPITDLKESIVPFTDPFRPQDHIDEVRKVGRLAQVLLDLRAEYEHKPQRVLLEQIVQRLDELTALRTELDKALTQPAPVGPPAA